MPSRRSPATSGMASSDSAIRSLRGMTADAGCDSVFPQRYGVPRANTQPVIPELIEMSMVVKPSAPAPARTLGTIRWL